MLAPLSPKSDGSGISLELDPVVGNDESPCPPAMGTAGARRSILASNLVKP
jgi:hypothetical protein